MESAECCDGLNVDAGRIAKAQEALVNPEVAERLAQVFTALGDPTRVRLISALAKTELCVGELAAAVSMSMSAVSHQLRLLRQLRLVKSRKQGRHVFYSLDDEHIEHILEYSLDHVLHD